VPLEINLTPQAFSYPTVANNGFIYCAPYGLNDVINYMIKFDPNTYQVTRIPLEVNNSTEKWQNGIVYRNLIYFLPYNESKILVLNTDDDSVEYIELNVVGRGKYIQGHIFDNRIIALPYGEHESYNWALDFNMDTNEVKLNYLEVDDDTKRWHTTQMLDGYIIGLPRGEDLETHFNHGIVYDCFDNSYELTNLVDKWADYDKEKYCNKKFTTVAKANKKLYAPPYSEYPGFDILATYKTRSFATSESWSFTKTGITSTSRKYFTHVVASNGKIFFPPAGHDEDWSEMLIIDSNTDKWHIKDLGIGKESKKYFAGVENSQGKLYFIPRGGCVCEPEDTWKSQGDLAEVLVVDTNTEEHYTVDVGEYFKDNTTIEKYNKCVIINDIIYAFPYGESDSFQTILVFDTIKEKVIKTIDLNNV